MMGATHLLAGATIGLILSRSTPDQLPPVLAVAVFTALLPDIDHRRSIAGRLLFPVSIPLGWFIKHRGITHSLVALGALMLVVNLLDPGEQLATAAGLGYASHLVMDIVTKSGIPLFAPLSWQRIKALPIRTGGFTEGVVALALLAWVISMAGGIYFRGR